ncbi:HhH-GPD-type base excision DNA repair protein [Saccharopolyspora sp. MS10]|uniref:HhH-GPD-type base excision DNA repair protein n=1 Tax=Saccharopolyspora sp. MS10 TaxID=3385973 RepID=UPI0039A1BBA4
MPKTLHLTGDAEADQLLSDDPFALLSGMLLDQQIAMEVAFAGPKKIAERMNGFSVARIAESDLEEFVELCVRKPAIHRYGGSMGKRVHALAQHVVEHYDGAAEAIWTGGDPDGREVLRRLKALPGYGDQKARIFLALLGKQLGVRPEGWREAAGAYGDPDTRRSIADVVDQRSLDEVRAWKKQQKAAAKQR